MENGNKFQRKNFYDEKDSALALLLMSFVPIVLSIALIFILSFLKIKVEEYSNAIWFLIISALITPLSSIISIFFVNGINGVKFSATKMTKKLKWQDILVSIFVASICFFGMINFIEIFNGVFSSIGIASSSIDLPLTNGWWLLIYIVLFGLLPGITEELVFRGIIFNGLRKNFSDGKAVIISALLFALIHASVYQLVYPFFMGIVFAILFLRTGSLLSSIIAHCFNNILVVVFSYLETNCGVSLYIGLSWWGILLSIVIAILLVLLLYLVDKFIFNRKTHENMNIEKEKSKSPNLMMIIALVIIGILFIANLFM